MPGRIPDSFIQELLARTDIVEVIGARLELKRAGREYKARSPFTDEKTPSFFVSPAKQMYFDFSSGKNGNAIGFVMGYDRVGFIDAVEMLAQRAGLEVPHEGSAGPGTELDGARAVLERAARLYRDQLHSDTQAQAYLAKRGINAATAERFDIGYAPATWDFLARQMKDPQAALAAGLLKQREQGKGCYDVFRHRLMFPIRDSRGRVIAFGGRTLGDDPAKYLNSPETPLFHKGRNLFGLYEARQASKSALQELIVVEGYVDAVMLSQYGVTHAVAALGTATTTEHAALLFRSAPRVIFCFDGDRAGRSAAHRALAPVLPELRGDREARFAFLPEGEDPDTLVQKLGHDGFLARMAQAQPLTEFLLDQLAEGCDMVTASGRARLIERAREPLARLAEGALRTVIIATLAERARLPAEDVQRLLRAPPPAPPEAATPAPAGQALPRSRSLRRALELLGEMPALATRVTDLRQLATAPVAGIPVLMSALEFFIEHPHSTVGQLLEQNLPANQRDSLTRLWARPLLEVDEAARVQEFDSAIAQLRHQALRARRQALLEQAEHDGMTPAIANEINALMGQLSKA
ncbi:MAG: DNA primase [Nevskiaceae bacterium]|nr:MAG: DNA primase [Nevskiaceae bacterium]TBR75010.1 MAG: DNA primase [Nevskiaceae bacterium]